VIYTRRSWFLRQELDPGEAEAIVVAAELAASFCSSMKNVAAASPSTVVWK
jgi:hypothetical protein